MNKKYVKYGEKWIKVVCILYLFFSIIVMAVSASYTVLQADDYSHGVGVYHVSILEYIAACVKYTCKVYREWQGTYFSMFIQALFSPINNGGLIQLRVVMVCNVLLFFFSLFYLIRSFLWNRRKDITIYLCYVSILFVLMNIRIYHEVFYWFSGAVSYSVPLSVAFLGLGYFVRGNKRMDSLYKKKIYYILSCIFLLMAAGGSLAVVGGLCYVLLLLLIYYFFRDGMWKRENIVVGAVTCLGAFVNAIAPGNYIRHAEFDTKIRILEAFMDTILVVFYEIKWLANNTVFVSMLIFGILIGFFVCRELGRESLECSAESVCRRSSTKSVCDMQRCKNGRVFHCAFFCAGGVLTAFFTVFPVILGYSSDVVPNRCLFITEISIVLSFFQLMVVLGYLLYQYRRSYLGFIVSLSAIFIPVSNEPSDCRESQISRLLGCRKLGALLLAVGVMILCVSLVSGNVQTRNLPQRAVASQLLDGRYQEYYKSCTDLYVYLEQTKEADVVIISMPDNIDCFNNLYISRDKDHYANRAMAQFYGKESIVIQ